MIEKTKIFLKGMLMGICDLIPGISGGTIAFITGIYERLINAIKSFSFPLLKDILKSIFGKSDKRSLKENIKKLDLGFLITLVAGIVASLLIFSRLMEYLLRDYFSLTMIFFVGLIIASAKTIFSHIEKHHTTNTLVAVVGLIIGISLAFLVPKQTDPSLLYVFVGGFIAISAMILPGISGSFILVILGIYGFMLNALSNFIFEYILVFVIGAIAGLLVISRLISFLFRKDKSKTLYFLLGLVVGALFIPLKQIYGGFSPTTGNILLHIILLCAGFAGAHFVEVLAKKR